MKRRDNQAGFTLIELMVASTLGLILLIATLGILNDSANIADVLRSRISLNAAARESFDLLLDGGRSGTEDIFGLRGLESSAVPPSSSLQVAGGNRVRIINNGATVALEGPRTAAGTIPCAAADDPIPYCTAAGPLAVQGYLGGGPTLNTARSIKDGVGVGIGAYRTQELELILFTPYLLGRPDVTTQQVTETYRTIFMTNPDLSP
jgi:prepilin-type N-terminal cleavage/methylation domain-containing protein